jgi:hypothetical protein
MFYTLQHYLGPLELDGARSIRHPDGKQLRAVEVQLRGRSALGQVTMVFDSPLSEWQIALLTPSRMACVDLFRDIVVPLGNDRTHKPQDILRTSVSAIVAHAVGTAMSGSLYASGRLFWGHDSLIRKFVDATRSGGQSPVPPSEAVSVVRLTDSLLSHLGLS